MLSTFFIKIKNKKKEKVAKKGQSAAKEPEDDEPDQETQKLTFKEIMGQFVVPDSIEEVNVSSRARKACVALLTATDPTAEEKTACLETLKDEVWRMMQKDTFKRFLAEGGKGSDAC